MSAIPQGAFATFKVKQNLMKPKKMNFGESEKGLKYFGQFASFDSNFEHPLLKYSSKLMNSIWGLYNRYSVHNLKKNTVSDTFNGYHNHRC